MPPRASVTALILPCMKFIRAFILLMGILCHSSNKAALNWSRVAGNSDAPLLSCPFCPEDVRLGTNMDCTEANRVG